MREIFGGREDLLGRLTGAMEGTEQGHQATMALIGPKGIGKTTLLREFQKRARAGGRSVPLLYVDFEKIVSSPEEFSLQYPAQLLSGYLEFNNQTVLKGGYQNLSRLEGMGQDLGLRNINEIILELKHQLDKEKRSQQRLVEMALSFPEELAMAVGRRFLVIIDEFPFLSDLNNFSGIKEVLDLFGKTVKNQGNLSYVISASNTPLMENLLSSNALYKKFRPIYIGVMDVQEGLSLISKILFQEGVGTDQGLNRTIYDYSFGHPFYMVHITQTAARLALTSKELNPDFISEAVAEEMLLPTGGVYLFCKYIYELALERARSKSLLKAILHLLVQRDGLSLTEKASLLKRTPGETSSLLQRLLEVDLVTKREGRYSLRDSLLKLWLKYIELKITTDQDYALAKERLIQDLNDEMCELKGKKVFDFDEEGISEIIKTSFKGQRLPGRLFKRRMDVVLVAANTVSNLTIEGGRGFLIEGIVASRAISSLSIGQSWMVVIETRKALGEPQLKSISSLKEELERSRGVIIDRVWIISEKGFSKKGLALAQEKKVLLSDKDDWRELKRLLE